jgi:hypothetical protein
MSRLLVVLAISLASCVADRPIAGQCSPCAHEAMAVIFMAEWEIEEQDEGRQSHVDNVGHELRRALADYWECLGED